MHPTGRAIFQYLRSVHLDPLTVLVTLLVLPLVYALLRIIRSYLKNWGAYLIEGVLYWLSRAIIHSLAGQLTLRRYCGLQIQKENKYLYVPSRHDVKVEIDRVFVTLTLDHQGGRAPDSYTHLNLLKAGNRLRIVGDPGSGKSSLTKRIFRDACVRGVAKPARSRLPVLLELRTLVIPGKIRDEGLGDWLYKGLRALVEETIVYKMGECFENYARTEGLLVLLDGLDEVSSTQYPRVQLAINALSDKLSSLSANNAIILTMRTQFHQQVREAFRETLGRALFIKPFTPSDIYEFLSQWPFPGDSPDWISTVYAELTDRPTLREMCANPLVLAMYVAERQANTLSVLPECRTDFYSRVVEELLIKRRAKQVGASQAAGKLREQRERILGKLAFDHTLDRKQPQNSLRWADAIKIIKSVMRCNEAKAGEVFREIAKETGLVAEERPGESIRFIHLTFCEFLAAYESVQGQEEGWKRLIAAHGEFRNDREPQVSSRLLEVIPFACGLAPRVRRGPAISDVTALGDHRLLARCFMETKAYEHQCWQQFLESARNALLGTPEGSWDEQWLRDLHLFNVVVRDANQCSTHAPAIVDTIDLAEFYKTLVSKQQNSLATLLSAYASQDGAAAFRLAEVCGMDLASEFPEVVVSNCDQSPFLALVVRQALNDRARLGLWSALLVEAALRSRAVAAALNQMPGVEELQGALLKTPRCKRWDATTPFVRSTFYTQLVTLALASEDTIVKRSCRIMRLLGQAPAPGALGWTGYIYRYSTILAPLALIGLQLWYMGLKHLGPKYLVGAHWPLWLVLPLIIFQYVLTLRSLALRGFYRSLLNLQPVPRKPSLHTLMHHLRTRPLFSLALSVDFILEAAGVSNTKPERLLMIRMAVQRRGLKPVGAWQNKSRT